MIKFYNMGWCSPSHFSTHTTPHFLCIIQTTYTPNKAIFFLQNTRDHFLSKQKMFETNRQLKQRCHALEEKTCTRPSKTSTREEQVPNILTSIKFLITHTHFLTRDVGSTMYHLSPLHQFHISPPTISRCHLTSSLPIATFFDCSYTTFVLPSERERAPLLLPLIWWCAWSCKLG